MLKQIMSITIIIIIKIGKETTIGKETAIGKETTKAIGKEIIRAFIGR